MMTARPTHMFPVAALSIAQGISFNVAAVALIATSQPAMYCLACTIGTGQFDARLVWPRCSLEDPELKIDSSSSSYTTTTVCRPLWHCDAALSRLFYRFVTLLTHASSTHVHCSLFVHGGLCGIGVAVQQRLEQGRCGFRVWHRKGTHVRISSGLPHRSNVPSRARLYERRCLGDFAPSGIGPFRSAAHGDIF